MRLSSAPKASPAAIQMPDEGWRKLTFRWGLFFLGLAVLNEIVWRTQTTDFWVSFKVFGLPALTRAVKLQNRAARVGFDWPDASGPRAKIDEELAELEQESDHQRMLEEMGDLLFAVVNLSRHLNIEPEAALRKANDKFTNRFNQLEQNFHASGRTLDAATLEEMDAEWEKIKAKNK